MKVYGFNNNNSQGQLLEQVTPTASGHDLLIKIEAIAINPVDTKVIAAMTETLSTPRIVGWDAAGTVIAAGEETVLFEPGDKVFYAGDISRPGCYASHQLVDERIVGKAPSTLTVQQIAAMPLTSITAWQALFSRLKIDQQYDAGKNILIIGGAGGVGSIAIQLAKQIAKLNVIATASQSTSIDWCKKMGADKSINHHGDLVQQYRSLGIKDPDYILCLNDTDQHFSAMADLIAPQGMICSIVGTQYKQDLDKLKSKSAGFVWEFMFTRPMFKTYDLIAQHHLLNTIAIMLDEGKLISTLTETIGPMNIDNIQKAHQQLQGGSTIGKLALTAII
jgi:zinc-binding alcohol dehydrogenase family protein